jgi:hypothetical protein
MNQGLSEEVLLVMLSFVIWPSCQIVIDNRLLPTFRKINLDISLKRFNISTLTVVVFLHWTPLKRLSMGDFRGPHFSPEMWGFLFGVYIFRIVLGKEKHYEKGELNNGSGNGMLCIHRCWMDSCISRARERTGE